MPARITRARARRPDVNHPDPKIVSKGQTDTKIKKINRVPLADRTNSASDENTSKDDPKDKMESMRPRRVQRIPARLADHEIARTPHKRKEVAPKNVSSNCPASPFQPHRDESVSTERPRRSVRLPSRFEDHSLSPSKFEPLNPSSASTPIPVKNRTTTIKNVGKTRSKKFLDKENQVSDDNNNPQASSYPVKRNLKTTPKGQEKTIAKQIDSVMISEKSQQIKNRATSVVSSLPQDETTHQSPKFSHPRIMKKSVSPIKLILSPKIKEKLAIYDFTYDPKEEPQIPKKKIKKQTVRKKAAPRRVVLRDNYSKNVEKKLENLKNILSKKTNAAVTKITDNSDKIITSTNSLGKKSDSNNAENKCTATINIQKTTSVVRDNNQMKSALEKCSHLSPPRLEMPTEYEEPPLSYSPIPNSHCALDSVNPSTSDNQHIPHNRDPLNLIEELSFFDEVPVASSSIVSRRSAEASPWRVNCAFQNKRPVNMYVKSSLTPAYESSFIDLDVDSNEEKGEKEKSKCGLFQDNVETGLKQTSILSFIQEQTQKHKRKSAITPIKNNSMFDGSHSSTLSDPPNSDLSGNKTANISNESIMSGAITEKVDKIPSTPVKNNNAVVTENEKGVNEFFGFDISGHEDQENISPRKTTQKLLKSKRIMKNRVGLSEFNHQRPMRLTTQPAKVFAPTSAVVNKLYEELKSVEDTPIVPDLETDGEKSLNVDSSPDSSADENVTSANEKSDSSVHLFEDIDIVHHNKPERKSYGKSRKVTIHQTAAVTYDSCASELSDDADSTFTVKNTRKRHTKKKNKKQEAEEKENEEAKAWAEEFNSMIEEVEDFPLVIE